MDVLYTEIPSRVNRLKVFNTMSNAKSWWSKKVSAHFYQMGEEFFPTCRFLSQILCRWGRRKFFLKAYNQFGPHFHVYLSFFRASKVIHVLSGVDGNSSRDSWRQLTVLYIFLFVILVQSLKNLVVEKNITNSTYTESKSLHTSQ